MDYRNIDQRINDILNGTRDLPQFNQPEHTGVCSAGSLLVGALIVCNNARESLSSSGNASGSQSSTSNWKIDEAQERQLQQWAESKIHLEDMHPANVFVEEHTAKPICIDCIVKFRRDK